MSSPGTRDSWCGSVAIRDRDFFRDRSKKIRSGDNCDTLLPCLKVDVLENEFFLPSNLLRILPVTKMACIKFNLLLVDQNAIIDGKLKSRHADFLIMNISALIPLFIPILF